jgi:hypothetical protein
MSNTPNIPLETVRARQKAMLSDVELDSIDMIMVMKKTLTADEFEDLIVAVYEADNQEGADMAIKDFYNDCY